jgi:ribosomal protein L44E
MADRFDKIRSFGRPKKEESDKKTKKIQLSMTEKQYIKMKKYQELFHLNTLTATIEYLIDQGEQRVIAELEMVRG